MKIGFIGLGKMGLPIAVRMAAAGHEVIAFYRNDAGLQKAKQAGLKAVNKLAGVCEGADIVISAISDDVALREMVLGSEGIAAHMAPGSALIETSTVSPAASAEAAKALEAKKIGYLRSPVSGSTVLASQGALTAMVSGPRKDFDRLEAVFAIFAKKAFYLGANDEARVMKLVANMMVGATSALLAEAMAFGVKGGLKIADAMEVITQSVVASPLIGYKKDLVIQGEYAPAFAVSQIMKDYDILLQAGREGHVPLPLTAQIRSQYEEAYVKGLGDKDFFVLVKEMIARAGV